MFCMTLIDEVKNVLNPSGYKKGAIARRSVDHFPGAEDKLHKTFWSQIIHIRVGGEVNTYHT